MLFVLSPDVGVRCLAKSGLWRILRKLPELARLLMYTDTPPATVRVSARNRREAMDWGLVLASQGIDATIENDPQVGWALLVSGRDYERAVDAIKQYRRENRRWSWQHPVFESGLLFDWTSLGWVVLVGLFYWLSNLNLKIGEAGVVSGTALAQGQWWRLFTGEFLHADILHFATNATFGFLLLGLAMGRFGSGNALLAAYLAGAGGNVASWLVYGSSHRGLGASGMVMGALGLIAVQSISLFKQHPHVWRMTFAGLAGGLMLFVLLGVSPESDVIAHLGGFVFGIMFGAILSLTPKFTTKPINLLTAFGFAGLVILTWLLALT